MIIICPNCGKYVIIESINCGIFRHGQYINGSQIPPHSSKYFCDDLVEKKKIWGCGRPFKIEKIGEEFKVSKCDYL